MQRHNHPTSKKLKTASINLVPTPQATFYRVSIFAKGAEIQVGENWLMNGQDFTQGAGITMQYPVRALGGFKLRKDHPGFLELTTDPLLESLTPETVWLTTSLPQQAVRAAELGITYEQIMALAETLNLGDDDANWFEAERQLIAEAEARLADEHAPKKEYMAVPDGSDEPAVRRIPWPGVIMLFVIAIIVGLSLLWLIGQMDAPAGQNPVVSPTPYLPTVVKTKEDQAAAPVVQEPAEQAEQPEQPVLPTEEPADAPRPTPLPTPTATPIYTPTWHSSVDLLRLDAIPEYLKKYEESLKACQGKGGKYGLVIVGGWNSARIRVANSNVPFEGTTCTASTVAYYHQSNAADVSYEGKFLIINHNFDDITVDGIPLHPRNDGVYDLIVRYFE